MKKLLTTLLCDAMALSLTACVGGGPDTADTVVPPNSSSDTGNADQIPSPFVEVDTPEDAADRAGFSFTVPDSLEGCSQRQLMVIPQELSQAIYHEGDEEDSGEESREILLRKAPSGNSGDISGDYEQYAEEKQATVDSRTVTLRGENGQIHCAIWTANGYDYSIGSSHGLSQEETEAIVRAMN